MSSRLHHNFALTSPRMTPPPAKAAGPLIWVAAVAVFIALFSQGFVRMGVAAWAVGLVYIVYDTGLLAFVAVKTWRLQDAKVALLCADYEPLSLGVIIAAWNEAPVLSATIEALRQQDRPPEMIVIADDGSDDAIAHVLAAAYGLTTPTVGAWSAASPVMPQLRWLRLPRGGKARALNAAIIGLECDIVVTVDADTRLDPGALSAMRTSFEGEASLVAATGVLRPVCAAGFSGRVFQWFQSYEYVRNFLSRYAWMQVGGLLLISGAFAGFRRDALVTVGGFDSDSLVEDYEVLHRLHRYGANHGLGWSVRVIGTATAQTEAPGTLPSFLRQRRRWFAGFLQTQYWNRDMIGNRRYGALGTAMLPVKALDTVQPLYGLAAFGLLISFIVSGRLMVARPVIIAMAVKVVIDLCWLFWSLRLYRKWSGQHAGLTARGALLAAIIEPFSFQLLRHAGAAWGWWVFVTRRQVWGASVRTAPSLPSASPAE